MGRLLSMRTWWSLRCATSARKSACRVLVAARRGLLGTSITQSNTIWSATAKMSTKSLSLIRGLKTSVEGISFLTLLFASTGQGPILSGTSAACSAAPQEVLLAASVPLGTLSFVTSHVYCALSTWIGRGALVFCATSSISRNPARWDRRWCCCILVITC